MILSEKWILDTIENEMAKVLFSDDPADWDWRAVAMVAARLIAKKLAEGVVFEEILDTSFDGILRLWRKEGTDRHWAGELDEPRLRDIAGLRVRVTVTKEEEDANKQ